MNSITLDSSLWLKTGQMLLNFLKGGNRVIDCSESSFVRRDIYLLVQDSTILLQWPVRLLIQYTFVETFSAKFKFFRDDVIAKVRLTTQT